LLLETVAQRMRLAMFQKLSVEQCPFGPSSSPWLGMTLGPEQFAHQEAGRSFSLDN
jgi:hypothetical protein